MNAEGIKEIQRMQSKIDCYTIGLKYLLIQLLMPDKEHVFPESGIPEIDIILDEIKKLQKEKVKNDR